MNKDVIYIDVDDDVTAIIGKIKAAKEKVVAIVPPKRSGALQSAVNLRLLDRMAKTSKKHLVLITNNQALVALAASASIPVAKNLQSKPELASIPALLVDDDDDIIDGKDLPVGDHARSIAVKDNSTDKAIETIDIDDLDAAPMSVGAAAAKKSKKSKVKIPSFDTFRKKLFFGIGGGILLVALLVWMFVFAPAATVIITAKTTPAPVSATVQLGGATATDFSKGVISSTSQEEKKNDTIEFTATGEKDLGEKATGTVRFSTSSLAGLGTIPAGTRLTSTSGLVFVTAQAVTLSYQGGTSSSGNTPVTSEASGDKYNGASGALSGAPANVTANFVGASSGGTTKVVKVVTGDDVERAKGEIIGKSTDETKTALAAKFTNGEKVIDSSFVVARGNQVSAPAIDQEAASGKATLTIETTYTIQAVSKGDLESYLSKSLESQLINKKTQKVYDTGIKDASLNNFRLEGTTATASLTATGQVGPQIDETAIKEQVKGKIFGEAQSTLQEIDGIQEVDVKFSYFWVRTIPNNLDKINIEFKVTND